MMGLSLFFPDCPGDIFHAVFLSSAIGLELKG